MIEHLQYWQKKKTLKQLPLCLSYPYIFPFINQIYRDITTGFRFSWVYVCCCDCLFSASFLVWYYSSCDGSQMSEAKTLLSTEEL